MTDKQPEWVETWLAENAVRLFEGSNERWVHDVALRAFLAKFVLCERDSRAVMHCKSGALEPAQDGCYWGTNWIPLHAPATKEPQG